MNKDADRFYYQYFQGFALNFKYFIIKYFFIFIKLSYHALESINLKLFYLVRSF